MDKKQPKTTLAEIGQRELTDPVARLAMKKTNLNLKTAEETANNSFSYRPASQPRYSKSKRRVTKSSTSKLLPLVLILIAIVGAGYFLLSTLLSPLQTIANAAMEVLNYSQVGIDKRTDRLLQVKTEADLNQVSKYKIVNDLKTVSPALESKLADNKISIDNNNHQVIFDNQVINSSELPNRLASDLNLVQAKSTATNAQRAVFQDQTWLNLQNSINVTQAGFDNTTNGKTSTSNLSAQELQLTSSQTSGFRFDTTVSEPNLNQTNSPTTSVSEANKLQAIRLNLSENLASTNQTADSLAEKQIAPIERTYTNLILSDPKFAQDASVCGLYQTAKMNRDYQKSDQASQLSKLAALIITEAEKEKSGDSNSETLNYLNNRLTKTLSYTDAKGNIINTGSAMDSYGYRMLTTGVSGPLDSNAQKYVIGANQAVSQSLSIVDRYATGLKEVALSLACGENSSPNFVGSFFSGIFQFILGINIEGDLASELAAAMTPEAQTNATETTLAAMTGLRTAPNLIGEDLGNSIYVGTEQLLTRSAQAGGGLILDKQQAMAYLGQNQEYIARAAAIERSNKSPFDASSPHTLVGKIVAQLAPITLKNKGLIEQLTGLIGVANQAWKQLLPTSKADDNRQLAANFEQCTDTEYLNADPNIALSNFCSPFFAQPVDTLNTNPIEIIETLVASGDLTIVDGTCDDHGLNCELESAGNLKTFETNCVKRGSQPIGIAGNGLDAGQSCVAKEGTNQKLYSTYFLDQRLQRIFDNDSKLKLTTIYKQWPVPNYSVISTEYGNRIDPISNRIKFHEGIDIPAPSDSPVVASISGSIKIGFDPNGYGNYIDLMDEAGNVYRYAHLSKILVNANQSVTAGQQIGLIGSTGKSTGSHLHFEIIIQNQSVDPLTQVQS